MSNLDNVENPLNSELEEEERLFIDYIIAYAIFIILILIFITVTFL